MAYRYLTKQAERMPELGLIEVQTGSLDPRDTSLALAIADAAVTRWITLDYILSALSGRNLREQEPRMQAVLLGGAAQLLFMDRVPAHAVIDESVKWAKQYIREGAGGMANAILRKVALVRGEKTEPGAQWNHQLDSIPLSDGSRLGLVGLELPPSGIIRLSVVCSIPTQLIQRWEKQFGDPTYQALHTLVRPPTLVYVGHATAPIDDELLAVHDSPNHRVFTGSRTQLIHLLADRDDLWVQDAASSRVVDELDLGFKPELIVDMCAGQGTKTRQLCDKYPNAQVIATEVDDARLDTLDRVFGDDPQVKIMHVDDLMRRKDFHADLILTDVPCSNTGVLARRREARYRPMKQQVARLIHIQRGIVNNAHAILREGGALVYSTCSLESDENEQQVERFVTKFGLTVHAQHRADPHGLGGEDPSSYCDGSYAAVLIKPKSSAVDPA